MSRAAAGAESVRMVPTGSLRGAFSPRSGGEDEAHVRVLAESETELPPILVHRPTGRVIDGMHRLRAARLRGMRDIPARFFDGSESEAFVLAVRSNVTHGLPLSTADRRQAARRILASHPHWSDRAVAEVAGLSAKSVAALRPAPPVVGDEPVARLGRDGRARPLSTDDARERASRLLLDNPDASLREIAGLTGISPGTVRDVRRRLKQGESPVPARRRAGPAEREGAALEELSGSLEFLVADPALRYSESGRALLRLLTAHLTLGRRRRELIAAVPAHCRPALARAARASAQLLVALADGLAGS
ncbi:ParB/RepB/Spo0J family partition protein [Symbioplanes lichenis]|uniref:ParB/RepB/Spo0J family partition protein n=1 Tax=Symbioplanes lichenis TaxID=1629072 RepID=UPI002738A819|nr:ParB N-terminal domain-containing protein [Actinoplanes lichenis]